MSIIKPDRNGGQDGRSSANPGRSLSVHADMVPFTGSLSAGEALGKGGCQFQGTRSRLAADRQDSESRRSAQQRESRLRLVTLSCDGL